MAKFRNKPVVIEAEQWFPPGDDRHKPIAGVQLGADSFTDFKKGLHEYFVTTIHGQTTKVVEGDWIITEPDGVHHYPCKPDIFAQRYEPIGTERPPCDPAPPPLI